MVHALLKAGVGKAGGLGGLAGFSGAWPIPGLGGARHDLCTILFSVVTTGVLAGCRILTTLWEHTTDLEGLGLPAGFS